MMDECVEETSEVSSVGWCRRLPMAPGSEPGPDAGEPSVRTPGDAARRGGVARPSPESDHTPTHVTDRTYEGPTHTSTHMYIHILNQTRTLIA